VPIEVILPKVDMDMATGKIARWFVAEGDMVAKGAPLFEIETDKAAMDVEAPASGILRGVSGGQGIDIPVGEVVAWIFGEGENTGPLLAGGVTEDFAARDPDGTPIRKSFRNKLLGLFSGARGRPGSVRILQGPVPGEGGQRRLPGAWRGRAGSICQPCPVQARAVGSRARRGGGSGCAPPSARGDKQSRPVQRRPGASRHGLPGAERRVVAQRCGNSRGPAAWLRRRSWKLAPPAVRLR
jgi:pyruvate/2-oxoglutarate dehydrogenase complex dihydrolipoamide acyltransferase (E2) component